MRKHIVWLFGISALTTLCAFASSPFSTGPAPTQSFHTVQSNAATVTTSSIPSTPTVTSAALDSGAAIITSNVQQPTTIASETGTVNRMQNLMNDYQAIGSSIRAINQNIAILQQQMLEMQSTRPNNTAQNWFAEIAQHSNLITVVCLGGVSLLLLACGILIGRKTTKKADISALFSPQCMQADVLGDGTPSEYDFMSSDAAIPAKLDLARAYIAMHDEEQARMVLKTIIEKGTQEQRSEALSLIQSMLKL